jgi:hypothetical protein
LKITDAGEFVDNVYRVQKANGLIGKMLGRTTTSEPVNHKKPFTAADICREGYLHKRGSWFKTW